MMSLINSEVIGIKNAHFLFIKYVPPNNAIAASGVKLNGLGKKRETAPKRMKRIRNLFLLSSCIGSVIYGKYKHTIFI